MDARSECKKFTRDLTELVRRVKNGETDANAAWQEMMRFNARVQQIAVYGEGDAELQDYLKKCNTFRERAALMILEKRQELQEMGTPVPPVVSRSTKPNKSPRSAKPNKSPRSNKASKSPRHANSLLRGPRGTPQAKPPTPYFFPRQ